MSRWRLLAASLAAAAAGVVAAACVELSGPQEELSSVSPIAVAWPSVVIGDVLRDIAGLEAPLHVDAFDEEGNAVTDATVNFITLNQGVSIDARGVVHGGPTASTTPVRIVAQIRRGASVIQTPEIQVDVVPRPDSVLPGKDTTYADTTTVGATESSPITVDTIEVRVMNRASGQGVKSWLVRFEILSEPPSGSGRRTTLYEDGGTPNERVSFDTTDVNGNASRAIVLQTVALQRPNSSEAERHNVRLLVTVGNTRAGGQATMVFVTLPIVVE